MLEGYIPLMVQRTLDRELGREPRYCYLCGEEIDAFAALCDDCAEWEEQKEQDYRDERDTAFAATNGTL